MDYAVIETSYPPGGSGPDLSREPHHKVTLFPSENTAKAHLQSLTGKSEGELFKRVDDKEEHGLSRL